MRLKSGNDGCCVNYWVPFILLDQYADFKARKKISSFLFFLLLAIFFSIIYLFSKYNLIFTLYFKICIRFYYWFCHSIFFFFFEQVFYFICLFLLYNIVLVLPYINMNPSWVYTCFQSWTPLPPSFPYHPSGSS